MSEEEYKKSKLYFEKQLLDRKEKLEKKRSESGVEDIKDNLEEYCDDSRKYWDENFRSQYRERIEKMKEKWENERSEEFCRSKSEEYYEVEKIIKLENQDLYEITKVSNKVRFKNLQYSDINYDKVIRDLKIENMYYDFCLSIIKSILKCFFELEWLICIGIGMFIGYIIYKGLVK